MFFHALVLTFDLYHILFQDEIALDIANDLATLVSVIYSNSRIVKMNINYVFPRGSGEQFILQSTNWTGPFWQCPVVLYPYFGRAKPAQTRVCRIAQLSTAQC